MEKRNKMQIFFQVIHRREMHDREINKQRAAGVSLKNGKSRCKIKKMLFWEIKCEKKTREKPAVRSAGYTKGLCGCSFHLTQLHDNRPDQTAKGFRLINNKMNCVRQLVILVV